MDLSHLNLIVLKIHHPEGCVSASSDVSGIQIVSSVHGVRQSLPIQGSLLWSLRDSAGLHAGHGDWLIQASSRERVLLSLRTVLRLFNSLGSRRQLGEVSACVASEDVLPRSPIGLCQFPGFSSPEMSQQASLNWLPVSIKRGSTCKILARVDGDAVLSDSAHSWGTAAVVPVCPSSGLGPLRSRSFCVVVFGDPPGSFLVVGPRAARARHLARAGVSPARLVVRLFRCRLGKRTSARK